MPVNAQIPLSGIAPKITSPSELMSLRNLAAETRTRESELEYLPKKRRMLERKFDVDEQTSLANIAKTYSEVGIANDEWNDKYRGTVRDIGLNAVMLGIGEGMNIENPQLAENMRKGMIQRLEEDWASGRLAARGWTQEQYDQARGQMMTRTPRDILAAQLDADKAIEMAGNAPLPNPSDAEQPPPEQPAEQPEGGVPLSTLSSGEAQEPPLMYVDPGATDREWWHVRNNEMGARGIDWPAWDKYPPDFWAERRRIEEGATQGDDEFFFDTPEIAPQEPGQQLPVQQNAPKPQVPRETPVALTPKEQYDRDMADADLYRQMAEGEGRWGERGSSTFLTQEQRDAALKQAESLEKRAKERFDAADKLRKSRAAENKTKEEKSAAERKFTFDVKKQFTTESKPFRELRTAYDIFMAAVLDPEITPQNTLAAATKFMKVLDPGSVVRESELGLALGTAGLIERTWLAFNRIKEGAEISAEQRAEFTQVVRDMYAVGEQQHQKLEGQYTSDAQAWEVDPARIVTDYKSQYGPNYAIPQHLVPPRAEVITNDSGVRMYSTGARDNEGKKIWRPIQK